MANSLSGIDGNSFPDHVTGTFNFAAAGDLIGPARPETIRLSPGFEKLVEILQSTDIAVANQEGSIFDVDDFTSHRAAENGGGYPVSDATVAADIKAMGFDIVSKANNHATDWGVEGLLASNRSLKSAGVAVAGAGRSLTAARAPAFVETSKGRVSVISAATTYTPMSPAGYADGEVAPRPGISVLRTTAVNLLDPVGFDAIKRLAAYQGSE